MRIQRFKSI